MQLESLEHAALRPVVWVAMAVMLLAAAIAHPANAADDAWEFDPEHTRVHVTWNHIGILASENNA